MYVRTIRAEPDRNECRPINYFFYGLHKSTTNHPTHSESLMGRGELHRASRACPYRGGGNGPVTPPKAAKARLERRRHGDVPKTHAAWAQRGGRVWAGPKGGTPPAHDKERKSGLSVVMGSGGVRARKTRQPEAIFHGPAWPDFLKAWRKSH